MFPFLINQEKSFTLRELFSYFFRPNCHSSIFFIEYYLHILIFFFPTMHYVHVFFRGS